MSTRATIIIREKDAAGKPMDIRLYHHSDGYPEGVGADLKRYLAGYSKRVDNPHGISFGWSAEDIATEIVQGGIKTSVSLDNDDEQHSDMGYEVANCQHGDEEYGYIIDCDTKTLTCYYLNLDQYDWTDAPVCKIPD